MAKAEKESLRYKAGLTVAHSVAGNSTLYFIVVGILLQILYAATGWLSRQEEFAGVLVRTIPSSFKLGCAIIGLITVSSVAEKMLPLQAISREAWVYRDRPRGRLCVVDSAAIGQMLTSGIFGALIGLAHHQVIGLEDFSAAAGCAATAMLLRLALGLRGGFRLSRILRAGDSRVFYFASLYLRDSELASKAIAATWCTSASVVSSRRMGRSVSLLSDGLLPIFFRRLRRRSYLGLLIVSAIFLAIGLVELSPGAVAIVFLSFWMIASAGVCRAADVSELGILSPLPKTVAMVMSVMGAIATTVIAGNPFSASGLVWSAIVAVGLFAGTVLRSRPRSGSGGYLADTGMGFSIDPEVFSYFTRGFGWLVSALVLGHFSMEL